jgi:hypothetical protein
LFRCSDVVQQNRARPNMQTWPKWPYIPEQITTNGNWGPMCIRASLLLTTQRRRRRRVQHTRLRLKPNVLTQIFPQPELKKTIPEARCRHQSAISLLLVRNSESTERDMSRVSPIVDQVSRQIGNCILSVKWDPCINRGCRTSLQNPGIPLLYLYVPPA